MSRNKCVSALCGIACGAVLAVAPALAEPFTVTDMTGRDVKFEKPAERIIVFPVPWSSTVIALDGSADKLVAVHPEAKIAIDEGVLADFYPRVKELPSNILAGGADKGFMPNVEAVAALKPDLVVQWGRRKDDFVGPLTNAGITTGAIVYGAEDNARQIMTFIAKSMGLSDKLGTLMQWRDDTAKVLADELAGVTEADKPKVAYFFYTTPEFHTEGKGSYMDWQINLAGGVNAAHEIDGNGAVSLEQIAKWDPDVILLGSFEPKVSVSRIYDDPILGGTKAAKSNRVYKVPVGGYRWDPPSQESPLMWMWLSSILHPDRFKFDVRATAADWYKKIYGKDLTQEQLDRILQLEMNAKGAGYERFARK